MRWVRYLEGSWELVLVITISTRVRWRRLYKEAAFSPLSSASRGENTDQGRSEAAGLVPGTGTLRPLCAEGEAAVGGVLELDPAQGEEEGEEGGVSSGLAAVGSGKALVGN